MNTNFRRFKTLALRTMAGDALKVDVNNVILRLTLRHVLTESLELKFLCENIAFVLNNNYK